MMTDTDTAPETAPGSAPRRLTAKLGSTVLQARGRWRTLVLALTLVVTAGFAVGYYFLEYRPDLQTDNATAQEVTRAASEGAVAILSYSPDTLSHDFDNAKSRLTGDFLDYYGRFTEQIVAPTAQRGQVTTTATVVRAAISELHPDSAVVLAFVNQKSVGKGSVQPVETGARILIDLTKVNGAWLIAKFEPV